MSFDLADTLDLLRRTPRVADALLRELPRRWLESDEGPGSWTAVDVVRHFVHGERTDWVPRVRHALEHGTAVSWPAFDPDGAARLVPEQSLGEMLDAFATERAANLVTIRDLELSADQLDSQAIHPTFGEVTLRQHLATWAAHDLDHLRQITRALALRHADDVGPWTEFMTILD